MPQRYRGAYPPEFRRQMVELVRAGRTPEQLAREFEPSIRSIRIWVAQAAEALRQLRRKRLVQSQYHPDRTEGLGLGRGADAARHG